jgi:hypothetical protein
MIRSPKSLIEPAGALGSPQYRTARSMRSRSRSTIRLSAEM